MLSLWQFYSEVQTTSRNKGWWIGQALWNRLIEVNEELFLKMREADIDPFFADSTDNPNFIEAIEFIEKNWQTKEDVSVVIYEVIMTTEFFEWHESGNFDRYVSGDGTRDSILKEIAELFKL